MNFIFSATIPLLQPLLGQRPCKIRPSVIPEVIINIFPQLRRVRQQAVNMAKNLGTSFEDFNNDTHAHTCRIGLTKENKNLFCHYHFKIHIQ